MKLTLAIDDDLVLHLRAQAERSGEPFETLVSATLRAGIGAGRRRPRHELPPLAKPEKPAVFDAEGLDELALAVVRKPAAPKTRS